MKNAEGRMHTVLVDAALPAVRQLGAARQQKICAGGKGRVCCDVQTHLARFFDGAHPSKQLCGVAISQCLFGVGRSVYAFLPQRRKYIARRDGTMAALDS